MFSMKKLFLACTLSLSSLSLYADGLLIANKLKNETKQFNVQLNPVSLLFKSLSGGVEYAVTERFAIGLRGHYMNGLKLQTKQLEMELKSYSVAATGTLFHRSFSENSFYLTGGLGMGGMEVEANNGIDRFNVSTSGVVNLLAIGGYRWVWDSGFNINLGAGAVYIPSPIKLEARDSLGNTSEKYAPQKLNMTAELMFGFLF